MYPRTPFDEDLIARNVELYAARVDAGLAIFADGPRPAVDSDARTPAGPLGEAARKARRELYDRVCRYRRKHPDANWPTVHGAVENPYWSCASFYAAMRREAELAPPDPAPGTPA